MSNPLDQYEAVIGLECHVQLMTQSKLFSPALNHFGDQPNLNTDVVDLGLPGVLPVVNQRAIEFATRLGIALKCEIHRRSVFARKHYFYPDLPKGYQISQYDEPICTNGELFIQTSSGTKRIGITRIHMEEDAGKNLHVEGGAASFVDYNRAGTPLVEIVTEPDIRSSEEAMEVYKTLRAMVMYLEICDGNLQEGSMRADLNVSVRKKGVTSLGTRTETKNLNSIRFLGQATDFEIRRQVLDVESGKSIKQETRLWDSNRKESRSMRSKEEAHDYRYFPDPDLVPLLLTQNYVDEIANNLPELPQAKAARFQTLGLGEYDALVLTSEKPIADYFERALTKHPNPKGIANWIINDVLRIVKEQGKDDEASGFNCKIPPESIATLVRLIDDQAISGKIAKLVFEKLAEQPETDPEKYVRDEGLIVEKDSSELNKIVAQVIADFPEEVAKYRSGKTQVFGFLMGQVMRLSQGKAHPKETSTLLEEALRRV